MRRIRLLVLSLLALGTANSQPGPQPLRQSIAGSVQSLAADGSELRLVSIDNGQEKVHVIQVASQSLKDRLKTAQNPQTAAVPCTSPICSCMCPGDKVVAKVAIDSNQAMSLEDIGPGLIQLHPLEPVGVLLAAIIVMLAITFFLSGRHVRALLFVGEDGRYSNSKTQISLWFGIVFAAYIATFYMRWFHTGLIGHINIPTNLMLLSGFSGLTYAAARGITAAKSANSVKETGVGKVKVAPENLLTNANFPSDLIRGDDGQFDLGDYQMMVITMIAVFSYLWISASFLSSISQCVSVTMPDVDSTVLTLFGVGQGAYLTKKAASDINH